MQSRRSELVTGAEIGTVREHVNRAERVTGAEHVNGAEHVTGAELILERVRDVPPGFVRTYGDISPGAPRFAGTVLHQCDDPTVPWHRIVRADGSLAKGQRQRRRLEREGVPFRGDKVQMSVARVPEL